MNDALGGGLYTCDFLEAYGKSGVGKTQLALHISAHACMRSNVLYVDTNGDFTALRLIQILSKHCPLQKVRGKLRKRSGVPVHKNSVAMIIDIATVYALEIALFAPCVT